MNVLTAPELRQLRRLQRHLGIIAVLLSFGCNGESDSDSSSDPGPPPSAAAPVRSTGRGPEIQVRILQDAQVVLLSQGRVTVEQPGSNRVLFGGKIRARSQVRASRSGLQMDDRPLPPDIIVRPVAETGEPATYVGLESQGQQRYFRGAMRFLRRLRRAGSEIEVINQLALEDYLRGVVGAEMPALYPLEALKAQAIASRTYALYSIREAAGDSSPAVFHSTPAFQVYAGIRSEHPRVIQAVDATSGLVLTYQGALFRAYFHSTCGGHTTAASSVFREPAIRPLEGAQCGRCEKSPYFRWEVSRTLGEIQSALTPWLAQRGVEASTIRQVRVSERGRSGRVRYVRIDSGDSTHDVRADRFQSLLNKLSGGRLRSLWYEVATEDGRITFRGRGWGHGIGLCQVGAGVQGKSAPFRDILASYYPGATVERLY